MTDEVTMDSDAGEMPHGDGPTAAAPEVDPARRNLVARWCRNVRRAKKHFAPDFKRMRENMDLVLYGASPEWVEAEQYVVPIIQRHINQSVAALYAKNPRAMAKRRKRLEYQLWDGDMQSLLAAQQSAMAGDMRGVPLLMDVQEAKTRQQMLDRTAKTVEILFHHFLDEQEPGFKGQLKQLVRRAKACGVGYLKLDYQRLLEPRPEVTAQINDVTSQIARMESLLQQAGEGGLAPDAAEVEELRTLLKDLQAQETLVVREGPVFEFPRSTDVIPDTACRQVDGFVGARWVAQEFMMTPDEVKETYKIDVAGRFTAYKPGGPSNRNVEESDEAAAPAGDLCCVWEIQDKRNRQFLTVIDGYPDFVREPASPTVQVERFWTLFPLTFNAIEHEKRLLPPSDVEVLKHPQMEYNRSRQSLREHRIANRPAYAAAKGALEDSDRTSLQSRPANAIVELKALKPGVSVDAILQAIKPAPIDPALYETNSVLEDVYRSVGAQEANLGGLSGATATESSIAEASRTTSLASNVDDLDDFLSQVARATGQLLLLEMDESTVRQIAGPGAVWPSVSRQEIAEEIYLEVKAGSSGRPNRAAELANMERGMPVLIQLPGVNPYPVAKKYLELLDIDLEETIVEGLPSITAMNMAAGKPAAAPTGDAGTDPNQQGAEGANNAPRAPNGNEGPQPAYPQSGGIAPDA